LQPRYRIVHAGERLTVRASSAERSILSILFDPLS
jgi:hypothetical protein